MKFLVDAQLPPALAASLRSEGYEAAHVAAFGWLRARDSEIWTHAVEDDWIIVTKDRDFADWAFTRLPRPQIVWVRFGNMPRSQLVLRLGAIWGRIAAELEEGVAVVEAH